jgi:amino acid adenylation domain-containing protein/non-ribosomal peptide synthase protein (TIGR01720 family)
MQSFTQPSTPLASPPLASTPLEGYELSPQQKHLWIVHQLTGANQPYRIQANISIAGAIDLAVFQSALQEVIDRHEILRTRFQSVPGVKLPLQVIQAASDQAITLLDWSHLSEAEQTAEMATFWQQTRSLPWEQSLQLSLIRQSAEHHCLMVSLSALCGDTASLKNLVQAIAQQYALRLSQSSPDEEPLQYADLAAWQSELLQENSATLNNWRQLNHEWEGRSLPLQPTEPAAALQPEKLTWDVPAPLAAQMNEGAAATLLTAWQILLWRLAGKTTLMLGVRQEDRHYEELEAAIGLLARTLPLVSSLKPNFSFQQALTQVQASLLEMASQQDTFAWKQGLPLQSAELETHALPLAFEFVDQSEFWTIAGISYRIAQLESCTDYFWIKLQGVQQADKLLVELHYNASQFAAADMQRLFEQFQTLFHQAIQAPETAISQLEILSAAEREQLLVTFNQTQAEPPLFTALQFWFEDQVDQTPDRTAIIFGDRHITYAELNAQANQLAHYLRSRGVGADTLVGLCMERSLEMVIALLGILKAGGAYVPIDPAYPRDRIAFILSEIQSPLLLTQSSLLSQLPDTHIPLFCLDRDWPTVTAYSTENLDRITAPDHLAYVIYTSGSTGQPKGVLIQHGGLTHYLNWAIRAYEVAQGEGTLVHSSLAFDLTVTSLWTPLLVGRSVELLPEDPSLETLREALVRRRNLSLVKITPAHLSVLSQQLSPEEVKGCTRRFIIGGENLTAESLSFWRNAAPETLLVNEYGPTETVVGCCVYTVPCHHSESGSVAIGRPIANTQLYLLDDSLQPVPIGVVGELFIGGAGVARGYLNRPDLTNERFIPNPFVGLNPQSPTLYRTGDLARYRPDGTLEYLGRTDYQVKLKGFRIELGEIEAVLRQHPEVREAIALVHTNSPASSQAHASDQQRLIAYIVPDAPLEVDQLRSFLQQRLPDYMVPALFIPLDQLPLTANGKVDRQALPDPETQLHNRQVQFTAPSTPTETQLATIWADLLRLERVGIHENFFELGGDSILSIQMTARANQVGLKITPKQVFQYQTIAQLAAIVSDASSSPHAPSSPHASGPVTPEIVTGGLQLTPIQHWFFEQEIAEPHHWNQSLLLEVQRTLAPAELEQIVTHLIQHHDGLRTYFIQDETGWQATHAEGHLSAPVTVVDLSQESPTVQRQKIEAIASELQTQLQLDQAPLLRVALFQLGANQPSRLLMIIHHLLVDGISWRILLEDFQTAYHQLQQRPIQLPAKTTSFQQWAETLQNCASQWQQEQTFWLNQAQQAQSALLSFPADDPEGENTVARSHTLTMTLTPDETQILLRELPKTHQVQIQEVLLTALTQTLTQWTGQSALWIDLEGHGREELGSTDLSRTVGWFTAIFPLLLHCQQQDSLSLLKSIQTQLRQIPHHGIGYGILRYLSRVPEIQAIPRPQVCFNYLGQTDTTFNASTLFRPAQESGGSARSPQGQRSHRLEINCVIADQQLRVHWTFSQAIYRTETLTSLTQRFQDHLRSLLSLHQRPGFSAANLSAADLQKLMTQLQVGK